VEELTALCQTQWGAVADPDIGEPAWCSSPVSAPTIYF